MFTTILEGIVNMKGRYESRESITKRFLRF